MKVYLFLAEGFEEIEALACVDILRRAKLDVSTVSLGDKYVTGSQGVTVKSDLLFDEITGDVDTLILPGGPGRKNYYAHEGLIELVKKHNSENKRIAAICGAPAFLAWLGVLDGKTAVCYPSEEGNMANAMLSGNIVEADGNIITSKAAGTTMQFSLKIVEVLMGAEAREKVKSEIFFHETLKN